MREFCVVVGLRMNIEDTAAVHLAASTSEPALLGAYVITLLMARSKQLTRLEPWHHDLIGWMLQNPAASGRDAAAHFGVTPVWISIVKHSPVFRAEFDRRREMISQAVAADIAEQASSLADGTRDFLASTGKTPA